MLKRLSCCWNVRSRKEAEVPWLAGRTPAKEITAIDWRCSRASAGNGKRNNRNERTHRSNETQDQLPRPRARMAAKLKGVATLSGETSRGAVSCIAWLGVS